MVTGSSNGSDIIRDRIITNTEIKREKKMVFSLMDGDVKEDIVSIKS